MIVNFKEAAEAYAYFMLSYFDKRFNGVENNYRIGHQ